MSKKDLKNILKTLLKSVPFLTQVFLLVACAFGLKIPQEVVTFVNPASNANPFLAMFMIGLMLDLRIEKSRLKEIGGILLTRHIVAFAAAAAFFFLLPLDLPLRQSVAIAVLAPVGTISTAMAVRAGGDPAMAAGANAKHGHMGPGVYASHSYERAHMDAVEGTFRLLQTYIV